MTVRNRNDILDQQQSLHYTDEVESQVANAIVLVSVP